MEKKKMTSEIICKDIINRFLSIESLKKTAKAEVKIPNIAQTRSSLIPIHLCVLIKQNVAFADFSTAS